MRFVRTISMMSTLFSALLLAGSLAAAPAAALRGLPIQAHRPDASALGARTPLVYVSDAKNNVIDIFNVQGHLLGEITDGLNAPVGMFVDSKHQLWVANSGANNVLVFPRGATAPAETLTDAPGDQPNDVTLCPDGTAYVANADNGGGVAVYPPGATSPSGYLEPELSNAPGNIFYVTCDQNGNVFANGEIGLSPAPGTVGWLGGQQKGYVFLSYLYVDGIKATSAGTLITIGAKGRKVVVTEISEAGKPTGRSFSAGTQSWADLALNGAANIVFGAVPGKAEGVARTFPGGAKSGTYKNANLAEPLGIAFDSGS